MNSNGSPDTLAVDRTGEPVPGHAPADGRRGRTPPAEDHEQARALMRRLRRGERQAMAELLSLYGGRVFAFLLNMVNNRHTAEDLTQETFLNVWKGRKRFDHQKGRFSTWAFTIAHRKAVSWLRKHGSRGRHERIASDLDAGGKLPESHAVGPAPDDGLLRREEHEVLAACVRQLPPGQRRVVLLRQEGLSNQEIAGILGKKPTQIAAAYFKAKARLQELLTAGEAG